MISFGKVRIIIILYILVLSLILYYLMVIKFFFLPLDFDFGLQILRIYHHHPFESYNHHQLLIPYQKMFLSLAKMFVDHPFKQFTLIYVVHYALSLFILWQIIAFISPHHFILNLAYFISISISGIFLFLILSFTDKILTLWLYFLSFLLFLKSYDRKHNLFFLSVSAILSAIATSINSTIGLSFRS